MIKSVMSWNEEVKKYNKQIKKIEDSLAEDEYFIVDTKENFEKKKSEYEGKEKLILSKYQQLIKLSENRDKIREAIMKSNATSYVKVADKTYTVALAIEKYRKADEFLQLLKYQIIKLENEKKKVEKKVELRIYELENKFFGNTRQPSESEKRIIEEAKHLNELVVCDPLNINEKFLKLQSETEEFKSLVNIALNEHNVKTEIEIDLD